MCLDFVYTLGLRFGKNGTTPTMKCKPNRSFVLNFSGDHHMDGAIKASDVLERSEIEGDTQRGTTQGYLKSCSTSKMNVKHSVSCFI